MRSRSGWSRSAVRRTCDWKSDRSSHKCCPPSTARWVPSAGSWPFTSRHYAPSSSRFTNRSPWHVTVVPAGTGSVSRTSSSAFSAGGRPAGACAPGWRGSRRRRSALRPSSFRHDAAIPTASIPGDYQASGEVGRHLPAVILEDNVWAGVSVEKRDYAYRSTILSQVPAVAPFFPAEPLLGPIPDLPHTMRQLQSRRIWTPVYHWNKTAGNVKVN